jgi:transketolase
VIDRNELQANAATEDLVPLEPIDGKLRAFGWAAATCDGHSFSSLAAAFSELPAERGRPTAIIARTVRGKGLPSLERRVDRWFVSFSRAEVDALLRELHGGGPAAVTSEPLLVR